MDLVPVIETLRNDSITRASYSAAVISSLILCNRKKPTILFTVGVMSATIIGMRIVVDYYDKPLEGIIDSIK